LHLKLASHGDGPSEDAQSLGPRRLGARVKALRQQRGWTLQLASERIGLSRSALSKIEREEMSPTFSALQRLAQGFGLGLIELLGRGRMELPTGRRSITRAGEGEVQDLPNYQLRLLVSDLKRTAFIPYEVVVRARALAEFEEWDRHPSEDFVYVLAGRIQLYTELYEPVVLGAGDSVFFDARMGHALLTLDDEPAKLLCISAMQGA
jgi:transcriptional regulator with XRE-family HTH domain